MSALPISSSLSGVSVSSYHASLVRTLVLIGLSIVGLQTSLFATNHYIRAGASGANNGTSWTNAYPTFASAGAAGLVRGDTYYIAGGTYPEDVYINVNLSGSLWLYFKKANLADNSADPGWNLSFETSVATIQSIDLDKGYVSFDGMTGSNTSGHGIHIKSPSITLPFVVLLENGKSPFILKHLNIEGPGYASSAGSIAGIYYSNASSVKNLLVSNCWIHEVTTNGVIFTATVGTSYIDYGFLFENNVISETGGCLDPTNHGQGMQLGLASEIGFCIIRNNKFDNVLGSAMIAFLSSFSGANHHDIQIYNNIFYTSNLAFFNGLSPGVIWAESDRGPYTNVHLDNLIIANNTFHGLSGSGQSGTITLESPVSNNILSNNIWENCRLTGAHTGFATQSNNGYFGNTLNVPSGTPKQVNGTASTFVNAAIFDFRLLPTGYAIGKSRNFPSVFTTDFAGLTRGGVWDMGAHQDHTTANAAPTNAQVGITVSP